MHAYKIQISISGPLIFILLWLMMTLDYYSRNKKRGKEKRRVEDGGTHDTGRESRVIPYHLPSKTKNPYFIQMVDLPWERTRHGKGRSEQQYLWITINHPYRLVSTYIQTHHHHPLVYCNYECNIYGVYLNITINEPI